jgi:hypothetical protein
VYTSEEREAIHMLYATFTAIAAVTTAFIFGLIATLSWQACLVVALAAAALAGGTVFTVLEMQRLGKHGN